MNCTNYHPIKPITTKAIDYDYVDYDDCDDCDDCDNHIDLNDHNNYNNKSEESIDITKIIDLYFSDEENKSKNNEYIEDIDEIDIQNIWQYSIGTKNQISPILPSKPTETPPQISPIVIKKGKIYEKFENVYTPTDSNIMNIYNTDKIINIFKLKQD